MSGLCDCCGWCSPSNLQPRECTGWSWLPRNRLAMSNLWVGRYGVSRSEPTPSDQCRFKIVVSAELIASRRCLRSQRGQPTSTPGLQTPTSCPKDTAARAGISGLPPKVSHETFGPCKLRNAKRMCAPGRIQGGADFLAIVSAWAIGGLGGTGLQGDAR